MHVLVYFEHVGSILCCREAVFETWGVCGNEGGVQTGPSCAVGGGGGKIGYSPTVGGGQKVERMEGVTTGCGVCCFGKSFSEARKLRQSVCG